MIKLIQFVLRYLSDESFRQLCDSALQFSKSIDTHLGLFGANSEPRSPQWTKVRDAHIKIDPICNVCGTKEDLNVHHIIPFHVDKSKELEPTNLITLCNHNGCHFTFGHLFNWSSSNPNVIVDAATFKQKKAVADESL
jgi:5-methylcytosine-specific restriction endonuclease McrA